MVSCIDHLARHSRQTLCQRQISLVLRFQPDCIELAACIGNGNPEDLDTRNFFQLLNDLPIRIVSDQFVLMQVDVLDPFRLWLSSRSGVCTAYDAPLSVSKTSAVSAGTQLHFSRTPFDHSAAYAFTVASAAPFTVIWKFSSPFSHETAEIQVSTSLRFLSAAAVSPSFCDACRIF